jgi:hypothetical protein
MRANILSRLLLKGFFKQMSHKIAILMQEIKKIDRTFNVSQTEENNVGVNMSICF